MCINKTLLQFYNNNNLIKDRQRALLHWLCSVGVAELGTGLLGTLKITKMYPENVFILQNIKSMPLNKSFWDYCN